MVTIVELDLQDKSVVASKYVLQTPIMGPIIHSTQCRQVFVYAGPTTMTVPRAYEGDNLALCWASVWMGDIVTEDSPIVVPDCLVIHRGSLQRSSPRRNARRPSCKVFALTTVSKIGMWRHFNKGPRYQI